MPTLLSKLTDISLERPYSSLAQSVEHLTVNQGVVGSSPTGGAKNGNAVTNVAALLLKTGL